MPGPMRHFSSAISGGLTLVQVVRLCVVASFVCNILISAPLSAYGQQQPRSDTVASSGGTQEGGPEDIRSGSPQAIASVESAIYRGTVQDLEIIDGTMTLQVTRRGEGPAWLNWSETNLFIHRLRWDQQRTLAGTTFEKQIVVGTYRDEDRLHGEWSAHGQEITGKRIFDLTFPPALNTQLLLRLPVDQSMESSRGVLSAPSAPNNGFREWTLELGNQATTTIKIAPTGEFQQVPLPRYELESEIRARRDGAFLKTDITIDGLSSLHGSLNLSLPSSMEVQSVTAFSGTSQIGAAMKFQRDPMDENVLIIPLGHLNLDSRLVLRLRAFQARNWGSPFEIPQVSLQNAVESRGVIQLRVEPPLQLQSADVDGLVQTNLTSDPTLGEVWRYESREPGSRLSVLIDEPRSDLSAEITCLTDLRRHSTWAAAVISMHAENGSRFHTTIQLPEDWKVISVAAGDLESRLASWSVDQRNLHVYWQNPITPISHRQLWVFARTSPWAQQSPVRLPLPQFRSSANVSVQYQVLLPQGTELQILEGDGWRLTENTPIAPSLLRLREVTERLSDPLSLTCTTLRSGAESRNSRTLVRLAPRAASGDTVSPMPLTAADPAGPNETENEEADFENLQLGVPVLEVSLTTSAGPSVLQGCVHQAELQFDRPVAASSLLLQLPASCTVSAVEMDGRAVTVFRYGNDIPLPAESTTVEHLKLTYTTQAVSDWLFQKVTVPLPRTSYPVSEFRWTLDLPGDQRLSQVDIPGVQFTPQSQGFFSRDLFGPLTRAPQEPIFNPVSWTSWRELFDSSNEEPSLPPVRRSWSFVSPVADSSVHFTTWNVTRTRHYAWVAMMFCLMTGAWARLFRIGWLRGLAIFWFIILAGVTLLVPPAWSLICGGMLTGSLLSMLVPRSWMQSRDFLHRSGRSLSPPLEAATTAILIVCLASTLRGDTSLPDSSTTATFIRSAVPSLSYLIESARYELLRLNPTPQIRARFSVLTAPDAREVFVRLPMQNVVFSASSECLVNGLSQPLIPSLGGDAMVVNLTPMLPLNESKSESPDLDEETTDDDEQSPISGPPETSINPEEWTRWEIQLDFTIRLGTLKGASDQAEPGTALGQGNSFQAIVPTVLDSTLQLPASLSDIAIEHWGRRIEEGASGTLIQLGPIGQLKTVSPGSLLTDAMGATAITLLDVSPLQFRGQTRLIPGPAGWPALLPLRFPAGCVISSITGSNVIDSIDNAPKPDETSLTLRLRTGSSASPVTINFELPANAEDHSSLTIPSFPLWGSSELMHCIGMSGPPTAALELVRTAGVVPLSLEEWPAEGDSGRGRPSLAAMLNSPQPIQLSWRRLSPHREASISERIVILRDRLEWTATIPIQVTLIPAFSHRLRIDPSVRIDSVTATGTGPNGDREVRYSRIGPDMTVFIPGGQIGSRTWTITGHVPLTQDTWTTLPTIRLLETTLTDSQLTLVDRTRWKVELESSPGNAVPILSGNPSPSVPQDVELGIYSPQSGPMPTRLRVVVPIEATRADAVTLLQIGTRNDWETLTTFHFTAVEAPLKRVIFRVPPEISGIRIRPSVLQYTSTSDEHGTTISVKIPDRFSSSATITISGKIQPGLRDRLLNRQSPAQTQPPVPLIDVLSAQKTSQFLLVDARSPIVPAPTASLRIDPAAFPSWAPAEWIQGVEQGSLVCYQQIRRDLTLTERSAAELSGKAEVALDETLVWVMRNGSVRGQSQLWIQSKEPTRFRILHDDKLQVTSVRSIEEGPLAFSKVPEGTIIELPAKQSVTGVQIFWSQEESKDATGLLRFDDDSSVPRLVGVCVEDQMTFSPGSARSVSGTEIWLNRWNALLKALPEAVGPLSIDSPLLVQIRKCQQAAATLIEQSPSSQRAHWNSEYMRLSEEWKQQQTNLVVTADQKFAEPETPQETSESAFVSLLTENSAGEQVRWMIPTSPDWTIHPFVEPPPRVSWPNVIVGTAVGLAIIGLLLSWPILVQIREFLADHPSINWMILGVIWWLWLTPSVVGVIMIVGNVFWVTGEWLGSKLKRWWTPRTAQE